MPRAKSELLKTQLRTDVCTGGMSLDCKREEHPHGKVRDVLCRRCHARMGCSWCVQIPRELICMNCNDWALAAGYHAHLAQAGKAKSATEIKKILDNPPF